MNRTYQFHDDTAQTIYEAITVLLQYEEGFYEPHPPTDEWKEQVKMAQATLAAQNRNLG